MTDRSLNKEIKLQELVSEFCNSSLIWEPILKGEREPEYTKRVFLPQFQAFVEDLNDRQLSLASDGSLSRPGSVSVGNNQVFYPDLSISLHGDRTIAFEVKYIGDVAYSSRLATAVGQALIYASAGYHFSHALLVSESGGSDFLGEDLRKLNIPLNQVGVGLHLISGQAPLLK
jgi:hypothetical protein